DVCSSDLRYFLERRSLKGLFLVVDVRRQLTDDDRQLLELAAARGLEVEILLTKADKLSRAQASRARAAVAGETGPGTGVHLFSPVDGRGAEEARRALEAMLAAGAPGGRPQGDEEKKSRAGGARDKVEQPDWGDRLRACKGRKAGE